MYLFACINGHRVDVLLCYDTGSNLWSEPVVTGIMPPADIHGHSICVVNDAIYTFGGFGRRYVSLYGKEVYKLDLKSLKWSHITTTVIQVIFMFCTNIFILVFSGTATDISFWTFDYGNQELHFYFW